MSDIRAKPPMRSAHLAAQERRRPCESGMGSRVLPTYDQTAQEETMMAFTAMLSELYDAFRRKIGADEPVAKAATEAVVIEDARFRSIDGKFDVRSHTVS